MTTPLINFTARRAVLMARKAAATRARLDEMSDELDESRAFLADRSRQRRPYVAPVSNVIPFPKSYRKAAP